ncbi:MAG: efflux RND transporter periplasmic adaptor subunit, partial [Anaerolineae bacterium]
AVPVEVAQAETGNIAATLSYSGDLQPGQSLQLVSIVAGAVEEVMVEVGDTVRAGDPILRVEDTTYRAQLKQAEAGLTVAQTNLIKMEKGPRAEQIALVETGLAVAQANLRKMQNGPRPEQLAMARAGVDAARGQLNSILTVTDDERTLAAANLAQTEAALKLAQFQYDQIKWAGQVGQTPQALQLQQATIAYETALAAYNLQVDPDESTLAPLKATIQQAEQGLALAEHPFTDEDFALVEAGVRQAELNLAMVKDPFTDEDFALARAGVAQAEAVVALAQYQVDNAILRAPFDGQVAEVYVTTGSVASPQSPAIKLISQDLEVLVDVPENQISTLHRNQPAALKVTAFPGQDFPALITSVAPAADSASHTFPVKISPLDEAGKLRAGMFADIAILLEEKTGVVLIPRSAVTIVRGQEVVYVVSADGKTVSMRPVVTGLSDDGRVEIVDGLAPDETVVVAGLSSLSDGAAVEIVARTE